MTQTDQDGGGRIARSALLVAALTATSTVLGLGRDIVVGAIFGAGAELDAYLVAQGLMNLVVTLVAAAWAKAAVPTWSREAASESGRCPGHRSLDVTLTLSLGALGVASIVMGLGADLVARALAPGFSPDQISMTATFTRIVLISAVLVAGTDLLAGLAQAHGRYFFAAVQGIPFNIVMIGAAAIAGPKFGVVALAWGFVAGSLLRLLLQFVPLARLRIPLRLRTDRREPGFVEIARLVPPILLGSAVANINTLVDRAVGSTLEEGTITALSYGWRLVHLPETVVVASLLVPLYPAMAKAADDRTTLAELTGHASATLLTVLTPVTVMYIAAAGPIVAVAFGHGNFGADSVARTATALAWYAPALLAVALRIVFSRACYVRGDSRGPLRAAAVAMVVNVVGDLLLAPVMGVAGLALATSVSLFIATAGVGWELVHRHRTLNLGRLGVTCARLGLAGAVCLAVGLVVGRVLGPAGDLAGQLIGLALIGLGVLVSYLAVLAALRAPELRDLRSLMPGGRGRRG